MPDFHTAEPIPSSARQELDKILNSGDLFRYHAAINEPSAVTLLEKEFAEMMGAKFALAVASCSAALFLSLKSLDLPRGAKVLIPAFTFAAVPSAVVHADCEPVLVEVGDNYRMNMEDFEQKISQGAQAVLVSHMRGHTSDLDTILSLAKEHDIPVIEDAAHSLGTTWNGQKIGTMGDVGCFSFQSYKLVNGGEGGILITDDEDLVARAVIMSGAYENNWQKHLISAKTFGKYQNMLPLYNTRMSNLAATVIRPQLAEVNRRATDGLRNHNYVADKINELPNITVPPALAPETRAPDSLQFNLVDVTDDQCKAFMKITGEAGLPISIFGLHGPNARVFWNWKFLKNTPELPKTRAMLMRACDLRLPANLNQETLDWVAQTIIEALAQVTTSKAA